MSEAQSHGTNPTTLAMHGGPREGVIFKSMIEVMKKISPIAKGRENREQGFAFRGVDDVYNELQPILAEIGIFTVPHVLQRLEEKVQVGSGKIWNHVKMEIIFDFVAIDGSYVVAGPFWGEGKDSGDKGSNKCEAIAHKYAFLQVFSIPTAEEKDPDATTPPQAAGKDAGGKPLVKPKGEEYQKTPAQLAAPASQKQRNLIFGILSKELKKTEEEVKAFCAKATGKPSSKDWLGSDIDTLMKAIAAEKGKKAPDQRQPGEEEGEFQRAPSGPL